VLQEIGRLREITFRAVGEGTGRSADLDAFDPHYLHLFVWDREASRIAGAYRLGLTDEIVPRSGLAGLYTYTLFKFGRRLLGRLGPAIELGRSFVVGDYQRSYAPLLLLWKGIGRFAAARPRYRRLFGAVSISDEYDSTTKEMLMSFLRLHCLDESLAAMLRPRNPPRGAIRRRPRFGVLQDRDLLSAVVHDINDVDELVREIESDAKGIPILLRQYLKLNARLLGFNIDPVFGNVLDGLFYVDLTQIDRCVLDRYMGRAEAAAFLGYHRLSMQGSGRQ
jgi:hypothetical protein